MHSEYLYVRILGNKSDLDFEYTGRWGELFLKRTRFWESPLVGEEFLFKEDLTGDLHGDLDETEMENY